jgi:DNA-binding SARP family transcriptional activator/ATP/maltotriose-dependent transcriptional regulator MalT
VPDRCATRPRVTRLLASAWDRRLTLVIAGSGYGKTTALHGLAPRCWIDLSVADRDVVRLAGRLRNGLGLARETVETTSTGPDDRATLADALAADLCSRLAETDEAVLVLDNVDQLGVGVPPNSAWQFLRTFCLQAPPQLHVVLAGRRLPDDRLLFEPSTDIARIGADELAFTATEIADLLDDVEGEPERLANECRTITGGWPVAVVLLRDRLDREPASARLDVIASIAAADGSPWRDIAGALLADEPESTAWILAAAATIGAVSPGLLAALEPELAKDDLNRDVTSLVERGLLTEANPSGLHPLSAVLAGWSAPAAETTRWRRAAAEWLDETGRLEMALECHQLVDAASVRTFVRRRGLALIGDGLASQLVDALATVGTGDEPALEAVLGQARQAAGDWYAAIESFRAAARGCDQGRLPAGAAWRYAALLYLCGDTEAGLEVLVSALEAGSTADEALVAAWRASLLWSTGDTAAARGWSDRAVAAALDSGDATARAAAHTSAALVAASEGDREANETHYRRALAAASEAGDTVQLARIRSNLSSRAFEEGNYRLAVREADAALAVGRGHSVLAGLALSNKAEALAALGQLDEARAAASEALASFEHTGSTMAASAHLVIASIDRERGDLVKARIGFERSIRLSETIGDAHTAAWARASLAWTLATDDPPLARAAAARAVEQSSDLERAAALCAAAWVELVDRRPEAAVEHARAAEAIGLEVNDVRGLAECWEIWALAESPPNVIRLEAALARWEEMANPIAALRCRLLIARCRGDALGERSVTAEFGARRVAVDVGPAELLRDARVTPDEVRILTLGRFQVVRGNDVVPVTEWQSRKARDLLKLLVARRGRPMTREAVAEALWPDEDGAQLGNRLSVLLSTVRRVLDPQRSRDADHYICSDGDAIAIRTERLSIDVVELIDSVRQARRMAADGQAERAEAVLRHAERLYQGDFLEEDAVADWAVDTREEALDAAQSTLRQLAAAETDYGDDESALGHLRRLLEHDTYDEQAWLELIRVLARLRRHGEARRQHARYARRMAELDVPSVPIAGLTHYQP